MGEGQAFDYEVLALEPRHRCNGNADSLSNILISLEAAICSRTSPDVRLGSRSALAALAAVSLSLATGLAAVGAQDSLCNSTPSPRISALLELVGPLEDN